jgi:hypothetical protein
MLCISYFACSRWIDIGSASSLPAAIRPQLVIVITAVNNLQLDEFLLTVHTNVESRLADSFSSTRIFRLAENSLSPLARYQRLREDIHLQSEESQNCRAFRRLVPPCGPTHICNHISKFDFLMTMRLGNPLPGELSNHLGNFL